MRILSFFLVGSLFGIVMTKSEAISWFRIIEMFRFESFHMYGIISVAIIISAMILGAMKFFKIRSLEGTIPAPKDIPLSFKRHLIAGSIFGLGWALIGSCPGPIFVLIGNGYLVFIIVVLSAMLGTYVYGALQSKLPH